jgi:ribosomal protein S5
MSKQELKDSLAVRRPVETNQANLKDQVVSINRCTKVVKGGKNLSFSALVAHASKGAEMMVEWAVFLHQDDDVLNVTK